MPESPTILSRIRPAIEKARVLVYLVRWSLIASAVGILAGSASAFLIVALNWATVTRESHLWLIWLLPVAGFLVALIYEHIGGAAGRGNNLILDEIHDPKATIPLRMTPLIVFATAVTHLFGGSVGREGTAVQTGASLADQLSKPLGLNPQDRRIILMAGMSAGFASVFGTPLAGAIFGLEVLAIGSITYDAIFACLIGAFVGDFITDAWGIHRDDYTVAHVPGFSLHGLFFSIVAGILFGLTAMAFARLTHFITGWFKKKFPYAPFRPLLGGAVVAIAVFAIHTTKYIGLGTETIIQSFHQHMPRYDWAGKFIFTSVTIGSGFRGGEVTPLFYIGATLGNALSSILPLPSTLLAAMGFVAVFAGAANTPIAGMLMAMQLFGPEAGAFASIACVVSYLFSGHSGIYHSQRVGQRKYWSVTRGRPTVAPSEAIIAKVEAEEDHEHLR